MSPVRLELLGFLDCRVRSARRVLLDLPEQLVHRAFRAFLVPQARPVRKVSRVCREPMARMVPSDRRESPDPLVR